MISTVLKTVGGIAVACLGVLALATMAPGLRAEQTVKSFTVTGRANVRVNTNDGSVRVSPGDGQQVEFRVDYQGYEVGKNLNIDAHQDGDHVELTARATGHWGFSWGNNNRRLHIEVKMPKDADVQVETGDGSVEAWGIDGNVAVHTGDGSVKANTLNGIIDLHTNDGSITVDTLKGDIRLRTGDGSIEARDLDGKCDADSGDGHVRLAGRFDSLNIKSIDGSVNTRVLPGSKMQSTWNIKTGDGSVDLVLPGDFQANIDASTGDGHISMGMPVTVEGTFSNSQIHGKMNGGGQPLFIHTGDGSIRLSKS
jgi:ferric-dicitrate binding protein FerR (iron transport regulator)